MSDDNDYVVDYGVHGDDDEDNGYDVNDDDADAANDAAADAHAVADADAVADAGDDADDDADDADADDIGGREAAPGAEYRQLPARVTSSLPSSTHF